MELLRTENNQTNTLAKGKYSKGEKFFKSLENRIDENRIKGINEDYWKDFESNSGKNKSSLNQYKSAVKRFIDAHDKDILTISNEELESYLDSFEGVTKNNQERYIKSFITFSIENNFNKALKSTNNDLILSLIPKEYKMLISVLMNK